MDTVGQLVEKLKNYPPEASLVGVFEATTNNDHTMSVFGVAGGVCDKDGHFKGYYGASAGEDKGSEADEDSDDLIKTNRFNGEKPLGPAIAIHFGRW